MNFRKIYSLMNESEALRRTMRKLFVLIAVALVGVSLAGCRQSTKSVHHHSAKTELIAKKKAKKAAAEKAKKAEQAKKAKLAKQKQAKLAAQQAVANQQTQQAQQNRQNQQIQRTEQNQSQQFNGQQASDAPQPPAGVDPSKWAEHDAYTSNGVLMRQWNDTGKYEGDPDVQYQTIKGQDAFNKAHGID